jgi:cyclase
MSKHFTPHPLTEGIFAAIATDGGAAISNSGLLDLGGQIVVFDTFLTLQAARDLRQAVEENFDRAPQLVINSHYHNDHTWGNQVFAPEAQILSSLRTRQLMETEGRAELEWCKANCAQRLESTRVEFQAAADERQRQQLTLWLGYYAGLVEAMPNLSMCMPNLTFNDRFEIHGSKHKAELITFSGAHCESDTILYLPGAGIVFMGDLLFVDCHPYLGEGDPLQLLKVLKDVSLLDADCFVPGHGRVGSKADLGILMEYIETCMETARIITSDGNASEERIAGLKVGEQYREWGLDRFYQGNIRFLCQRLGSPAGG